MKTIRSENSPAMLSKTFGLTLESAKNFINITDPHKVDLNEIMQFDTSNETKEQERILKESEKLLNQ